VQPLQRLERQEQGKHENGRDGDDAEREPGAERHAMRSVMLKGQAHAEAERRAWGHERSSGRGVRDVRRTAAVPEVVYKECSAAQQGNLSTKDTDLSAPVVLVGVTV
jgi:hypothetical protein